MKTQHQDAKVAKRVLLGALCAFVFAFPGCGTPRGYDADLTPDDDGAPWIGGQLQGYSPAVRSAMRAELAAHPWCAWCGTKAGLQVHHICPVSRNPALAAEPSNLVTLCYECHWVLAHRRDWRKAVWNLRTVIETALELGPIGADEETHTETQSSQRTPPASIRVNPRPHLSAPSASPCESEALR